MVNLSSFLSESKNIKIKIHSAITWSVVLTSVQLGYPPPPKKKTHTHTHALKVFQNRELRKILGPKNEVQETEQNSITRRSMIGTPYQILKWWTMRWAEHMIRLGGKSMHMFWLEI